MNTRDQLSRKTHSRARRRIAALLAACLLAVTVSTITALPASAAQPAKVCDAGVLFIGVRGTNAPAGSTPSQSGRGWLTGGHGDQIAPLVAKFKTQYPYNSDWPTYVESLNYAATSDIFGSALDGAQKLVKELNWVASTCTYMPAIVLAGHSQGAMVIHQALTNTYNGTISAKAKGAIRAVALMGDPQYRSSMPYFAPNTHPSGTGLYPADPGQITKLANEYSYMGYAQGSTNPNPTLIYKVREYCYTGDAVCQSNNTTSGWQIHSAYSVLADQIFSWMNYQLTDFS